MNQKQSRNRGSPRQLTIRGFDEALERRLHQLARAEGISLNQAALRLLRRGAGLDAAGTRAGVVGDALDHLIGTWSDEQANEVLTAARDFETVDDDLWR